jgi:glycosyltransferase involved in cell wall biosynthesis
MDRTPTVYFCHEPLRILYETMPPRPYDRPEAAHRQLLNRIDPLPGLYREDLKANDQQNMRAADLVLANSKFIKQSVREIYTVEAKVNYKGVDTELFRPIDVEREPLILAVGSVTPLKAFDFVVESLSRVPQEYRYRLVIASNFQNPPERDYILSLADQLDVELEMLSDISDELLVELYNRAYLAVYSPIREPLGLVPLEAMACGTPVVAVSEGGIKETVLNGETGFLTPRDADQFARAIQKLVTNPDLAASFGEQGRKHVLANWTWERAVIGLEQHFTALQ